MRDRPALKLTRLTVAHNVILTWWSAGMFLVGTYDLLSRWSERGVAEIFCSLDPRAANRGRYPYIVYLFYLSKYYELLDTVILVLKKKKVIFLHWYHHAIVITMVWCWLESGTVYAHQGLLFNTFVHIWMYHYYCLAALGQSVWYKRYITALQIIQFVTAMVLTIIYFWVSFTRGCSAKERIAVVYSTVTNLSFLLLFIQFYRVTYHQGRRPSKESVKKD